MSRGETFTSTIAKCGIKTTASQSNREIEEALTLNALRMCLAGIARCCSMLQQSSVLDIITLCCTVPYCNPMKKLIQASKDHSNSRR